MPVERKHLPLGQKVSKLNWRLRGLLLLQPHLTTLNWHLRGLLLLQAHLLSATLDSKCACLVEMDFVYPRSMVFAGNTEFWTVLPSCRIQAYNSVKLNNSKIHGVWFSSQDSAVFLFQRWLKSIFVVEILNQGTMCRWKNLKRFHGLQLDRRKSCGISVDLVSVLGFVVLYTG